MPMKKITFLIFLSLIACTIQGNQKQNITPEVHEDIEELNTKITLRESLGMKDIYDATGVISLDLKNNSDDTVLFPSNFGAKIYVQIDSKWEEVENVFGYSNQDIVLPTREQYAPGLVVTVAPKLSQTTVRPVVLRITVEGALKDSGQKVGADIKVTIE